MSRGSMTKSWLAAVGAVLAVSGCTCGEPPCTLDTVTFQAPVHGDEVGPNVNVTVRGLDSQGQFVDLGLATLEWKGAADADFGHGREGTIEGGTASFADVALAIGTTSLRAKLQQKDRTTCEKVSEPISVVVRDQTPTPVVTGVTFPQDQNHDGTLNATELPAGTAIVVQATSTNAEGGVAQVLDSNDQPVGASATVASGAASLSLPDSATGYSNLFVQVTRAGKSNSRSGNLGAVASIAVDRVAPTCAVTAPTKALLGAVDDVDNTKAGYQLRAAAQVNEEAQSLSFTLAGGAAPVVSGALLPTSGASSFDFDVPSTGATAYTITVEARDSVGNVCTATRAVTVDFVIPNIVITAPTSATGTVATFNLNATATVSGADGQQLCFFGSGPVTGEVALGCGTVDAGAAVVAINIPRNGTWTLIARVTSLSGNASEATATGVVVNSPLCTATLSVTPLVIGAMVSSGNYPVVGNTSCGGSATTLKVNGVAAGTVNAASTGEALYSVPVADGLYAFEFCVTNVAQNPPTCASLTSTVQLQRPTIDAPVAADMWLNLAQDSNAAAAGVQRQFRFTGSVPTGGTGVVCSNQRPAPPTASACPDGASGWWVLRQSPTSPDPAFTFPDGSYELKVVVHLGSVSNVSLPLTVNADSVRPCVAPSSILVMGDVNPHDGKLNIAEKAAAPNGKPRISFSLGCGDSAAAIKRVVVKASSEAACVSASPRTEYTVYPADVTLSGFAGIAAMSQNIVTTTEASPKFGVELTDEAGNTNVLCAGPGLVVDDAALTALAIDLAVPCVAPGTLGLVQDTSVPKDNRLSAAELASNAGVAQLRFDLGCGDTAASIGGVSVKRVVTCGAAATPFSAYPADVSFAAATATANLSLLATTASEQAYEVGVELTDSAGNTNTVCGTTGTDAAAILAFEVDTVAPVCAIVEPSSALYNASDDESVSAGFQLASRVDTSADVLTTAVVTAISGGGTEGTATRQAGTDSLFNELTLPKPSASSYTYSATCTDPAGNATAAVAKIFTVDSVIPTVAITAPTAASNPVLTFNPTATATVTGADGQELCFYGSGAVPGEVSLGCGTVPSGGAAAVAINFTKNGTWNLVARVTSAVGNAGEGSTAGVVVNSPLCTASLAVPPLVVASMVTGGNYSVSGSTDCPSVSTTLKTNGGSAQTVTSSAGGAVQFAVPVASGAYSFELCVTNLGLNPPTCTTVATTVQLTAPTIDTPLAVNMPLNVAADLDLVTPGVQRGLTFTAALPSGGTAVICSNQTPAPGGSDACPDGVAGWVLHQLVASPAPVPVPSFTFPDGSYDVRLVVNVGGVGGVSNVSLPLAVVADSVRPCVAATTLQVVQDTLAPTGHLSIAEVAAAPGSNPQLRFTLGCGDSTISKVEVRPVEACANPRPAFNTVAAVSFAGAVGTVALNQNLTTTEADYHWGLELTDAAGNTNVVCGATGLDPAATVLIRVDRVAPTCTIVKPALAAYTQFDDADALSAGFQLDTQVDTSSDVLTAAVVAALAPTAPAAGTTRSVNSVTNQYTLAAPAVDTYAYAATCTDQSGNATVAVPKTFSVDSSLCTVAFTRPAACPAFVTSRDLVSGQYPFEIRSANCVGRPARIYVDASPSPLCPGGVIAANGRSQCSAVVSDGPHTIRGEVDNNTGAPSESSCAITFASNAPVITNPVAAEAGPPSVINASQDSTPGTPGAQRVIRYTATIPAGGAADVCINQMAGSTGQPCADSSSGWYTLATNVVTNDFNFTYPEGEYRIKLVVVSGLTVDVSPTVPLRVDVTKPCVAAGTLILPQDSNSDARLNIAELGAALPRVRLTEAPGCLDPAAGGNPGVVVKDAVGSTVYNLPADVSFGAQGAPITVNLSQNVAAEKDYVLFVELTDWVGNRNEYVVAGPAEKAVRIDTVLPTCSVSQPAKSGTLNIADLPGSSLTALISTSSDAVAVPMTLTSGATVLSQTGTAPASPAFTSQTSFSVSGDSTWTLVATCADTAGNQATATKAWRVDLVAPTCSIASPVAGDYSSNPTTRVNATGQVGNVTLTSSIDGTYAPFAPNADNATITYANGRHTLSASVADDTGNQGTCTVNNVNVNTTQCQLSVLGLHPGAGTEWVNAANSSNGSSAVIQVSSPNCGSKQVVLKNRVTSLTLATITLDAGGAGSFPARAVADGDQYLVSIDNGTGLLTTKNVDVDLVAPGYNTLLLNALPQTGLPLYLVAETGNPRAAANGYYADKDGAVAGGQVDISANLTGAIGGTFDVLLNSAPLIAQVAVTTSPQAVLLSPLSVPQNSSGTFELRVTDPAGNTTSLLNTTMTVDVIAPNPVTPILTLQNKQAATVVVDWNRVYDDAATSGSGSVVSYDLAWTTRSTQGNGSLASVAIYEGGAVTRMNGLSAALIQRTLTLPPLNTYYVSVRAKDEVDNHSAFVAGVSLDNPWTPVLLTAPVAASQYGATIAASASLNNDGITDLVVAAPSRGTNIGSVYVYYGVNGFSAATSYQELTPPNGIAGNFGSDVSTDGDIGNTGSEKKNDLVIGQSGFAIPNAAPPPATFTVGRALLYFGVDGVGATQVNPANVIEIRGDSTTNRIGFVTRILKDIDGDTLDEVALVASSYSSNRGRIYIFKGRSFANWQTAASLTDPVTSAKYMLVTSADWILEGPSPLLAASGNVFGGSKNGLISLGDLDGTPDGKNEFFVPMSRETINRGHSYSGATIAASVPGTPVQTSGAYQLFSRLAGPDSATTGFTASAAGGRSFIAGAGNDLAVGYPVLSGGGTVFLYSNLNANTVSCDPLVVPCGSPWLTITGTYVSGTPGTGPVKFGTKLSLGDVNGDGADDLLVSEGGTADNGMWVLYQFSNTYDPSVGVLAPPRFNVSELRPVAGTTNVGAGSAIADLDGANGNDIIASDSTNGAIRIWFVR